MNSVYIRMHLVCEIAKEICGIRADIYVADISESSLECISLKSEKVCWMQTVGSKFENHVRLSMA